MDFLLELEAGSPESRTEITEALTEWIEERSDLAPAFVQGLRIAMPWERQGGAVTRPLLMPRPTAERFRLHQYAAVIMRQVVHFTSPQTDPLPQWSWSVLWDPTGVRGRSTTLFAAREHCDSLLTLRGWKLLSAVEDDPHLWLET